MAIEITAEKFELRMRIIGSMSPEQCSQLLEVISEQVDLFRAENGINDVATMGEVVTVVSPRRATAKA